MQYLRRFLAGEEEPDADVAALLMGKKPSSKNSKTTIKEAFSNNGSNGVHVEKSAIPVDTGDFLSEEEKAALNAGIAEDAEAIAEAETENIHSSGIVEKSIEDETLRLDLTLAFSTQNYESLTDKQIKEAIFELKKEPFSERVNSKNFIKIYPKDMQKEFVKVIIGSNISETDEHIRKKLIEFLESFLK